MMIKHKKGSKQSIPLPSDHLKVGQEPNKVDAINAKCSALETLPLCKICKDIVDDYLSIYPIRLFSCLLLYYPQFY